MAKLVCLLALTAALLGLRLTDTEAGLIPGPFRCNLSATSLNQTHTMVLFLNHQDILQDPADPTIGVMAFAFGRNMTRGAGVSAEVWVPPSGGTEIMARETPGPVSPFFRTWHVVCGPSLALPCNGSVIDAGLSGNFTAPMVVDGFSCVPAVDP